MTPTELEAIEARCKAATREPWKQYDWRVFHFDEAYPEDLVYICCLANNKTSRTPQAHSNAAFIAHARTDLPKLCADYRELMKDKERLDWLIKQGPEGACEGMGLNGEVWDCAVAFVTDDREESTDAIVVRLAIDAARALKEPK